MQFSRLKRTGNELVVEIKSVKSAENLCIWLERIRKNDQVFANDLVMAIQGDLAKEAIRVPLETPFSIEDAVADIDLQAQNMTVTVKVKPAAANLSNVEHISSGVDTDTESMHTVASEIDSISAVLDEIKGIQRIEVQVSPSSQNTPLPTTPRLGIPSSVKAEESSTDDIDEIVQIVIENKPKKKNKKKKKKKNKVVAVDSIEACSRPSEDSLQLNERNPSTPRVVEELKEESYSATDDGERVIQDQKEHEPTKGKATECLFATKAECTVGRKPFRRDLSGPYISQGLAKQRSKDKGEDAWILKPESTWRLCNDPSSSFTTETGVAAWGIFDGHGGKQVATYASNSLLKEVLAATEQPELPCDVNNNPLDSSALDVMNTILEPEDSAELLLQANLANRLPYAMRDAFKRCNSEANRRFRTGGTTATLAMSTGWELIVANVGDSLAFLDTGAEVLAVSGNHRLEDNKNEVERILSSGGEVSPSLIEGEPAGPIRVWPGGLAMSRSIGDTDAEDRVCAEPEICQVTIPVRGGRLIMGSDGLWDALHPKTAAHHVRNLNAEAAAHRLLTMAINKDHLKDDVTVIVVDFMPNETDKIPPVLTAPRQQTPKLTRVWHPLSICHQRMDVVAAGVERRRSLLAEAEAQREEQIELERRRAEIEAEEAAKRALKTDHSMNSSSLYAELAHLTLQPSDIAAAFEEAKSDNRKERWEKVKIHSSNSKSMRHSKMKAISSERDGESGDQKTNTKKSQESVDELSNANEKHDQKGLSYAREPQRGPRQRNKRITATMATTQGKNIVNCGLYSSWNDHAPSSQPVPFQQGDPVKYKAGKKKLRGTRNRAGVQKTAIALREETPGFQTIGEITANCVRSASPRGPPPPTAVPVPINLASSALHNTNLAEESSTTAMQKKKKARYRGSTTKMPVSASDHHEMSRERSI